MDQPEKSENLPVHLFYDEIMGIVLQGLGARRGDKIRIELIPTEWEYVDSGDLEDNFIRITKAKIHVWEGPYHLGQFWFEV